MTKAAEWVARANQRLGRCGVRLQVQGKFDNLYIRGMFPTRDGTGKKQRAIALKMRALTQEDVRAAESIAREIALDLNQGRFDWGRFSDADVGSAEGTIGYWAERLLREKREQCTPYTFRYAYELLAATLPLDKPITEDALYLWILEQDPDNSTMRKKYAAIARGLLEMAGIGDRKIRGLAGKVEIEAINPRELIEDDEIERLWKLVSDEDERWGWVYGVMATYGLRNHEVFRLDASQFPVLRVEQGKTGDRLIPPLYPEWVDRFRLTPEAKFPDRLIWEPSLANDKLGRKISNHFRKAGLHNPYVLRHCWARRALVTGIDTPIAAKLMGHSEECHVRRYRAFIGDSVYVAAAQRIIAGRSNDK